MTNNNPKPRLGEVLPLGATGEALMTLDELMAELQKLKNTHGNIDLQLKRIDADSISLRGPNQPTYCCQAAEVIPLRDIPLIPAFQ